jgi:hypothetical protein
LDIKTMVLNAVNEIEARNSGLLWLLFSFAQGLVDELNTSVKEL